MEIKIIRNQKLELTIGNFYESVIGHAVSYEVNRREYRQ